MDVLKLPNKDMHDGSSLFGSKYVVSGVVCIIRLGVRNQ